MVIIWYNWNRIIIPFINFNDLFHIYSFLPKKILTAIKFYLLKNSASNSYYDKSIICNSNLVKWTNRKEISLQEHNYAPTNQHHEKVIANSLERSTMPDHAFTGRPLSSNINPMSKIIQSRKSRMNSPRLPQKKSNLLQCKPRIHLNLNLNNRWINPNSHKMKLN